MTTLHPSGFVDINEAYIEIPCTITITDITGMMPPLTEFEIPLSAILSDAFINREATASPPPPTNPHCDEDCGHCQKCDGSFSDFVERCKRKAKPITESVILTPIQQRLVNDIVDFDFPILNQYVNELYDEFDDEEDDYLMSLVKDYLRYHKQRFNSINTEFKETYAKRQHQRYFKNRIAEELIAEALHPCRVEAQMAQFDDMESFFEAMEC